MIGFVYVRDIPKLIICFVISIVAFLILTFPIFYFFPNGGDTAATLAMIALAGSFVLGWWAGSNVWEWVDLNLASWSVKHREKRMPNCYACRCAPEQKHDTSWHIWYECPRCGRRGRSYHMVFDNDAARNAIFSWEETIKTTSATITTK
jgi:hypothetical protein